jgi:hypothetical protein
VHWREIQIDGVRVDTGSFDSGGSGDVAIWLRGRVAEPPPDAVDAGAGRWWLPYHGTNLAPNPGFIWGREPVQNGHIPAGFFALYRSGDAVMEIPPGGVHSALRFDGHAIQSVSGYPLAVDPESLYLMGATVATSGRFTLGRRCLPLANMPRHNLWVNALGESDLRVEWQQIDPARPVAHLGPAHPSGSVAACQLVLEAREGVTVVDNVFWVKLSDAR